MRDWGRGRFRGWFSRHRHDIDQFLVTYPRLMWLRKWLQAIFENEDNLQSQITTLADSQIEGIDSKSIDLTVTDTPMTEITDFDPLAEEVDYTYSKPNPTIEADVILSKEVDSLTVGTPPAPTYSWPADNATVIKDDGVFTPDLLPVINEIYNEVQAGEETSLTGATFNTLSSFGLSFTGLNYHSFFEKETGVYFAYSGTTTQTKLDPTFTGNILAVFDRTGNLLSFLNLQPLSGHVIGNILNVFVSYSKATGDYYIEIGCDNESAFAFVANKNLVFQNTLNVDKTVTVTEFTSFETFGTVIGSDNTAIPTSGAATANWYNQTVTVWNTQSNQFAYGRRANFYNGAALTAFNADNSVQITATTPMVGASADYYGNLVASWNSNEGQVVAFFKATQGANTLNQQIAREIIYPTTGGAGTTLLTYTKKLGTLEVLSSETNSPGIYGVQILNQSKDASESQREWTILLNHAQNGINDSRTSFVSGFGNSSLSIYHSLVNSDETGINDLLQISSNFEKQLAGVSMAGEFNLSRAAKYGIDFSSLNDMPDRQTGLLAKGYANAQVFGVHNSKVALNRFTQGLSWQAPAINAAGGVFDNTTEIKAWRRVILACPYPGNTNAGAISEWVVDDVDSLVNRNLNVQDTDSVNLTRVGDWPTGDEIETLSADVILSKWSTTLSNNFGSWAVPNGTTIRGDGVWSPDYTAAMNDYGNELQKLKNQDLTVTDTNSVNLTKSGSWLGGDEIENIKADLNVSSSDTTETINGMGSYDVKNGSTVRGDGVWSPDYGPVINDMGGNIATLKAQDVAVTDTNSVNLTKTGDWQSGDATENLKADVNISSSTTSVTISGIGTETIANGSTIRDDGLWSPNWGPMLTDVGQELTTLKAQDLSVADTYSVNLTKTGDWQSGDATESLKADVILEGGTKEVDFGGDYDFQLPNAITIDPDGLWANDYKQAIQQLVDFNNNLKSLYIPQYTTIYTNPDDSSPVGQANLSQPIDDFDAILINYHIGSSNFELIESTNGFYRSNTVPNLSSSAQGNEVPQLYNVSVNAWNYDNSDANKVNTETGFWVSTDGTKMFANLLAYETYSVTTGNRTHWYHKFPDSSGSVLDGGVNDWQNQMAIIYQIQGVQYKVKTDFTS